MKYGVLSTWQSSQVLRARNYFRRRREESDEETEQDETIWT